MEITNVVFKQEFDEKTLEHLRTLRATRLTLAEKMLFELEKTASEIEARGLYDNVDMEELRIELVDRVATMRERVEQPDMIFEDEITLYSDLLAEGAPRD
jgi:hypothetical protein